MFSCCSARPGGEGQSRNQRPIAAREEDKHTSVLVNKGDTKLTKLKTPYANLIIARIFTGEQHQGALVIDRDELVVDVMKTVADKTPHADYERGMHHYNKENYEQALPFLEEAAKQEHAGAQNSLGVMYYHGEGVTTDDAKAVKWYQLSADQGYAEAQYYLGHMYQNGFGVDEDDAKAFELVTSAAKQGHAPAQCYLGDMYRYGEGVDQDYAKAIEWYKLSAGQGDTDAQTSLDSLLQQHPELAQQQPTDPHIPPS